MISNCMVLTEGWDMPDVGCCILARPTKKMGLYRQMIGRVLRPADGKPDAIVLDLLMREMDGFEVLSRIKENPTLSITDIFYRS